MELELLLQRHNKIMHSLCCLPRKILQLHGKENITEYVLYELCGEHCFNIERAAYLIDNPDFNCFQGIAGYCKPEVFKEKQNIWENAAEFSTSMKESSFNNEVRSISQISLKRNGKSDKHIADIIGNQLGMKQYAYMSWPGKHDNFGFLLYEKEKEDSCVNEHFENGLSLLSFCPIF